MLLLILEEGFQMYHKFFVIVATFTISSVFHIFYRQLYYLRYSFIVNTSSIVTINIDILNTSVSEIFDSILCLLLIVHFAMMLLHQQTQQFLRLDLLLH